MRLEHGKALHCHLALRLGERDDGRGLAVSCHAVLSVCLCRLGMDGGAITNVCAPSPLEARNAPTSPQKGLQNSGAEDMLQNQHVLEVYAP
jgi:hypothetical protein